MNDYGATARVIPAMMVSIDEGRLRVIETPLQPVKPHDAVAAVLTAHCPDATPDVWAVKVERLCETDWVLTAGRDRIHISAHTVDRTDEVIVYVLLPRQCIVLRNAATVTDEEICREMREGDWRLAATIGAWYRWMMTEVD